MYRTSYFINLKLCEVHEIAVINKRIVHKTLVSTIFLIKRGKNGKSLVTMF